MTRTFKTTLIWHDNRGGECEADVHVSYVGRKGYAGDRIDPPEPDGVEITDIIPVIAEDVIPERFFEDDALLDECLEDWANDEIEAAEWRAQCRRDDALMDAVARSTDGGQA